MSRNPRILLSDAHLADGGRVPKGTYLDVVPGGWLETALGGPGNLLAVPEASAETAALGHAGLAN